MTRLLLRVRLASDQGQGSAPPFHFLHASSATVVVLVSVLVSDQMVMGWFCCGGTDPGGCCTCVCHVPAGVN